MRPKSSSLASTQLTVFGGGGMLPMTPRTPSPPSNMEVETLCFGGRQSRAQASGRAGAKWRYEGTIADRGVFVPPRLGVSRFTILS